MYKDDQRQIIHTIVAIDPDVDRNGVACLDLVSKQLSVQNLSFPETLDFFLSMRESQKRDTMVIIEAGWFNHTHWHVKRRDSGKVIAAKGNAVGRNHEVGRKLAEMCDHWSIPYRLVKPLRKIWKGTDGKITATELERLLVSHGVKFSFARSNQEERDACLLIISNLSQT